jgi:hypothetical protein
MSKVGALLGLLDDDLEVRSGGKERVEANEGVTLSVSVSIFVAISLVFRRNRWLGIGRRIKMANKLFGSWSFETPSG